MNTTQLIFLKHFLVLAGLIFFFSCKKEVRPATREELLSANTWKFDKLTTPSILNPATDSSILKSCASDDLIKILSSKSYTFSDEANKCDTTVFPYGTGTWQLNTPKDSIVFTTTTRPSPMKWKIVSLSSSQLNIQFFDSISPTNKRMKSILFRK